MSAYGVQCFDGSGTLLFDSTVAIGGVVVDYRILADTAAGTFTYPTFAGYSAFLVNDPDDGSIVLDTGLGYPRVTVTATPGNPGRQLQLWCY